MHKMTKSVNKLWSNMFIFFFFIHNSFYLAESSLVKVIEDLISEDTKHVSQTQFVEQTSLTAGSAMYSTFPDMKPTPRCKIYKKKDKVADFWRWHKFHIDKNLTSINHQPCVTAWLNQPILFENSIFTRPNNFTHLVYNRVPKCGSTTRVVSSEFKTRINSSARLEF